MWKNFLWHPSNGAMSAVPRTAVLSLDELRRRKKPDSEDHWIQYLDLSKDPTIGVGETLNFSDPKFIRLQFLDLRNCGLGEIHGLQSLVSLSSLNLDANNLTTVPGLSHLHRLKTLSLRFNQLTGEVLDLHGLYWLWHLNLSHNPIGVLPASLQSSTQLTHLVMNNCQLTDGSVIEGITSLQVINVNSNLLTRLNLKKLKDLKRIEACSNQLTSVDFGKTMFTHLKYLIFFNNQITELPRVSAPNLLEVNFARNRITMVHAIGPKTRDTPKSPYHVGLGWPNLQSLFLDENQLTAIRFGYFKKLSEVSLNGNALSVFPKFAAPEVLNKLSVSRNLITQVSDLVKFSGLGFLNISYNMITCIENIADCSSLDELGMSGNPLDYSGMVKLAYGLSKTKIGALHISHMPVPFALGCVKTLRLLEFTPDEVDVPVTLGGLDISPVSGYVDIKHHWSNIFFPYLYTPQNLEIIACFGKPCRQTIFMILLCLQQLARLGRPYVYSDITSMIFSYWQAKDFSRW